MRLTDVLLTDMQARGKASEIIAALHERGDGFDLWWNALSEKSQADIVEEVMTILQTEE